MPNLKVALSILLTTFHQYASKDGDSKSLTKAEMKELLQNELGELLGKADDKAAVDDIFSQLDLNQDNCVDFPEFMITVAALASALHAELIKS